MQVTEKKKGYAPPPVPTCRFCGGKGGIHTITRREGFFLISKAACSICKHKDMKGVTDVM